MNRGVSNVGFDFRSSGGGIDMLPQRRIAELLLSQIKKLIASGVWVAIARRSTDVLIDFSGEGSIDDANLHALGQRRNRSACCIHNRPGYYTSCWSVT